MRLIRIGLATGLRAGAMLALLSLPVMAQTMQMTPQQGATSLPSSPRGTALPGTGGRTATNPGMSPATPRAAMPSGPLNINTASAAELDALPGIGKVRADAIIKNRPYRTPDELSSRHILPSNIYNKIKSDLVARPG